MKSFIFKLGFLGLAIYLSLMPSSTLADAGSCNDVFKSETKLVSQQRANSHRIDSLKIRRLSEEVAQRPGVNKRWALDAPENFWSFKISYEPGKTLFRGMSFKEFDQIRNLVKYGIDSSQSSFKRLFFDETPQVGMYYAFHPDNGGLAQGQIPVLIEVSRKFVRTSKSANGFRVTRKSVPSEALVRIYVLDTNQSADFPFLSFTPKEFLAWVSNSQF